MQINPLVVASFFLAITDAATFQMEKKSFSVERVRNPGFTSLNGPAELYKTYAKYNMPIPSGLKTRIMAEKEALANTQRRDRLKRGKNMSARNSLNVVHARAQNGTVTATPESGEVAWLCPVDIGGQTLNLDFDTGSSDLWVFSTSLPSSSSQGHTVFDSSKSSSFKNMEGASWKIGYGDGSSASGTVGTDVVTVGSVVAKGQAVELATQISQQFSQDSNNDGLLGLGFSSINTVKPTQQKTFFETVSPTLALPVFAANLKHGTAGSYDFGEIDSSKYSGDLTYVPIDNSQGWWEFPSSGGSAIADTGTTLALASQDIVDSYYKGVQGAKNDQSVGGYTFPCSAALPDLALPIGDSYKATISGDLVNLSPVSQGSSTCFGGLQVTTQNGLGVYGDIMFKGQFVVFDGGKNQLGFAPHA